MIHPSDLITTEGGWSILLLDTIFVVPWMMAVLFWPIPSLIGGAIFLVVTLGVMYLGRRLGLL